MNAEAVTPELPPVPEAVTDRIGLVQYEEEGGFPVEHGYIWTTCASVAVSYTHLTLPTICSV